jgi:hypothetical protein
MATTAGILWGATQGVDWSLSLLLIKALAIAILGGLDSIPGVLIAGIIVGLAESLATGIHRPARRRRHARHRRLGHHPDDAAAEASRPVRPRTYREGVRRPTCSTAAPASATPATRTSASSGRCPSTAAGLRSSSVLALPRHAPLLLDRLLSGRLPAPLAHLVDGGARAQPPDGRGGPDPPRLRRGHGDRRLYVGAHGARRRSASRSP